MSTTEVKKSISNLLMIGPLLVSIFLLSATHTDPVNVTKLFILGGVGMGALSIFVTRGIQTAWQAFKMPLLVVFGFEILLVANLFTSNAPFTQNFYGVYGRNNGVLTYLLFSFILLAALLLTQRESFKKVVYSFLATGLINIVYCLWVLSFGDFIGWDNPYKSILGLLGNPDFISALLGMFIAGSLSLILSNEFPVNFRVFFAIAGALAFYEIMKSHAIQGLVVSVGSIGLVALFKIRARFESKFVLVTFVVISAIIGLFAVLGTLQRGPLDFLYKRSVSLRGSYWHAGLSMGWKNPFTGVGLDTYGDWYRRTRPPVALIDTPGINTVSNVAHNVVIDFFASGGFPLLISYVAILLLGAGAILRFIIRNKAYDPIFVSIASIWTCYQVQSFISINQIGLAIWGWVFTGLLLGYEMSSRTKNNFDISAPNRDQIKKNLGSGNPISSNLIVGIGISIGLLVAAPPFLADSKWFLALNSRSVTNVEDALSSSLFNPSDSAKYFQAVNVFQTSNLPDQARKYALKAVKYNPDYFDAWKILFHLPNTTKLEKLDALKNMKRLDPNNPDVSAP